MNWRVELTRRFARDFDGLPLHVHGAVDRRLDQLQNNPFQTDIRKLTGSISTYRVRAGDYRIILDLDADQQIVTLLRVLHRRESYR